MVKEQKQGWFHRLKAGLTKTSKQLSSGFEGLLQRRRIDEQALEELEATLIMADLGVKTVQSIVESLRKQRFGKEITDQDLRAFLVEEIHGRLQPHARPLDKDLFHFDEHRPLVMMVVGVNGSGKTTTLGKLAQWFADQGIGVCLAAGDVFRAAAIEQLGVWAKRSNVHFFTSDMHKDPASLAYEAYAYSKDNAIDVLMIDTAGRLHTNRGLMDELAKIRRVLQKHDPHAPHETLLVLDGTLGQNSCQQALAFHQTCPLTGLIVTKLDGTAKGGAVLSVAKETSLPIVAIGVGEGLDDLQPFNALAFAQSLVGYDGSMPDEIDDPNQSERPVHDL